MGYQQLIKAAAVTLTLAYCGLLAYHQGHHAGNSYNEFLDKPELPDIEVITAPSVGDKSNLIEAPETFSLNDIFISVKTTGRYQENRLPVILKTWFQLAKDQTWFFTDVSNSTHQNLTNGHMVNTNCPDSHQLKHLCCKMSEEFDFYLHTDKKWFCHFDDDNYVNVPRLEAVLRGYNPNDEWYLGRNSIYEPVKLYTKRTNMFKGAFWFATGGAGFCISRALANRMKAVASNGNIEKICEKIRFPDDVTIGYIIVHLLKRKLTVLKEFHSHYEQMKFLEPEKFRDQISLSYLKTGKDTWDVVLVPGFNTTYDPTRFLSLHCFLFPHFDFCPR